ncbi:sugar transferase [Microbacterium sp. Mcb102]|uniref:sugar transferase n=1 Tax=Microbacterium sp. Mcb102 TaxID=2926012 RepID=UPI0021C81EB7|nr:sugar transferase [Microbacterium sp. Mcb102]
MTVYRSVGKRSLDVFGAMIALPALGIAVAVVAPLVLLSDRGPVFYRSRRRGRDGTHFTMLKFRSMTPDAPDLRNADLSTVNSDSDARVTRLGRLLRKTSVDELPQIINVLKGDMSFVGPRPNMTRQSWDELSDVERKRIRVRPGITGLSQALHRNAASTRLKYRLDGLYVDRVSLGLDATVLVKTFTSVFAGKNINAAPHAREKARRA